ncbi:MAG: hypothetical protein U9Q83_12060 [Bacteroidota bacterium]|nr:hypothetical protein [Bacteroidota bacterium]
MNDKNKKEQILSIISEKAVLKQKVFDKTFEIFNVLKKSLNDLEIEYNQNLKTQDSRIRIKYYDKGIFQCELKVAGDILVFYMHSNIFEFDREHKIWSMPTAKKDKDATYSGIISIYNFLADSFKYNRHEDYGYLIARIFINKEKHFFVEGKQQMGYLSDKFGDQILDQNNLISIIESAILYSQKFDLLVPPYEKVSIVNVSKILEARRQGIQTGKRLGFSFNADDIRGEKLFYSGG